VADSYSTLYRFARAHCDFGHPTVTVRVVEPPPGELAEIDFGLLGLWTEPATGQRIQVGGAWARTGSPQAVATASYNAGNQQLALGTETMTYDLNGNLATVTDAGGTTIYTWDARNRLTGLTGPAPTASFGYDGLGRRWTKTISGTRTDFLYDGLTPVQELNGAAILANLLTGLGIDEVFTRTDAAGTDALLVDAVGSTLALTDPTGTVITQYTYEPFGATTASGSPSANPTQYTGRVNDGTGLYYYRARYYDPRSSRLLSEDLMGLSSGMNLYRYADNDPTNRSDPSGLLVINTTSNTIHVKPEFDPTAVPLGPGDIYWRRHDGIATPCSQPNQVYKSIDFVPIIVLPSGSVFTVGPNQTFGGGWKDEQWLEELHKLGDHGWDSLFSAARLPAGRNGGRYGLSCQ
jgi:RHS repeat-associated protein